MDKVLGTHLYQKAFKKSPVVFGALPSLHAATAMCFSLFVARYGGKWGHIVMFLYSSLMVSRSIWMGAASARADDLTI